MASLFCFCSKEQACLLILGQSKPRTLFIGGLGAALPGRGPLGVWLDLGLDVFFVSSGIASHD